MKEIIAVVVVGVALAGLIWNGQSSINARLAGLDDRLHGVETELAGLRGRFDGMDAQLAFLRDDITSRDALIGADNTQGTAQATPGNDG